MFIANIIIVDYCVAKLAFQRQIELRDEARGAGV